jgi:protein gp37
MGFAHRFAGPGKPYEALTTIRRGKVDWSGVVRLIPEQLGQPLRWRKPRRIFVNSMSDLFHESLSNEQIATVFRVMAIAKHHTFQVLTKRPKRAAEWFEWVAGQQGDEGTHHPQAVLHMSGARNGLPFSIGPSVWGPAPWPLPNVWIGISAENQAAADERIPLLLTLPAVVRFVSAEPLLGPLNLHPWLCEHGSVGRPEQKMGHYCTPTSGIDWLIVGGESGNGARPFDVAWAESIVRQCADARVACFVKQLGAVPFDSRESDRGTDEPHPDGPGADLSCRLQLDNRKGGDMSEWPENLRVRQFPEVRV